jgi:antitoxin VapB
MALNIKDKETEALVAQIAALTGETKTGAVREAVRERLERVLLERRFGGDPRRDAAAMRRWLETEIWSLFPPETLGEEPMTKAEREEILGYGPDGF